MVLTLSEKIIAEPNTLVGVVTMAGFVGPISGSQPSVGSILQKISKQSGISRNNSGIYKGEQGMLAPNDKNANRRIIFRKTMGEAVDWEA